MSIWAYLSHLELRDHRARIEIAESRLEAIRDILNKNLINIQGALDGINDKIESVEKRAKYLQ